MNKPKDYGYLRDHLRELDRLGRPQSNDKGAPVTVAELDNAITHIVRLFDELIAELESK